MHDEEELLELLETLFTLGAPMKGEAYFYADILTGRVGPEQTAADAKYEFD